MRKPILTVLVVSIAACMGGCASTHQVSNDPLGAAPEDFSIDVTVSCGPAASNRTEAHLRPGRFMLFPDGSLHYGMRDGRTANWRPNRVRTLDRRQVADNWV